MKIVYILLCVAGLWLSYQAGQNEVELVCQKRFEDLRTLSEQEKKSSDQRIADLESARVNERIQNNERIKELDRKYQSYIQSNSDLDKCPIDLELVKLLSETASDPRLPISEHPRRTEDKEASD